MEEDFYWVNWGGGRKPFLYKRESVLCPESHISYPDRLELQYRDSSHGGWVDFGCFMEGEPLIKREPLSVPSKERFFSYMKKKKCA